MTSLKSQTNEILLRMIDSDKKMIKVCDNENGKRYYRDCVSKIRRELRSRK